MYCTSTNSSFAIKPESIISNQSGLIVLTSKLHLQYNVSFLKFFLAVYLATEAGHQFLRNYNIWDNLQLIISICSMPQVSAIDLEIRPLEMRWSYHSGVFGSFRISTNRFRWLLANETTCMNDCYHICPVLFSIFFLF